VSRWIRALCLLAIFVTASVTAGKAYLFCIPMQQAVQACCCAGEHRPDPEQIAREGATIERTCCDGRFIDELPTSSTPAPHASVPPAMITIADPIVVPAVRTTSFERRVDPLPPRAARYGPSRAGPRSAADACVDLQVFRC
jgi:hypothetical protein